MAKKYTQEQIERAMAKVARNMGYSNHIANPNGGKNSWFRLFTDTHRLLRKLNRELYDREYLRGYEKAKRKFKERP